MLRVTLRGLAARKLRLVLTGLAIVIGVTFVTGTLVLGDTLDQSVNGLISTAYSKISFQIRGDAQFSSSTSGIGASNNREPVPESVVAAVSELPGVQFAYGYVTGYAQFVARDGSVIGKGGRAGKSAGFSFDPNPQLSTVTLVSGHAPVGPHDVVMDVATAQKYHFARGDRVKVLIPNGPQTFTITGLVKFGSDSNLLGSTLAGFALPTAQRIWDLEGRYDLINVQARSGTDQAALAAAIRRVLPKGAQVLSGQAIANQVTSSVDSQLGFLDTVLLIFALISLLVGSFTIFNTFSITVGQRTRELALLRIVGASRSQVFRSVITEAALTGLVASLIGLGLGFAAADGLKALLGAFGIKLPSASLVFAWRTPVVALAVGTIVTVLSAILPARRAIRIAPVAALGAAVESPGGSHRRRLIAGCVLWVLALLGVLDGVAGANTTLVGVGAALAFIATGLIVPAIARPLASALGRPLQAMLGPAGRLGRENATRNPGRTAQTAAALLIGMVLVSIIAVFGDSLSTSVGDQIDSAVRADYLVTGGTVPNSVPPLVARLSGVTAATAVYYGQFEARGSVQSLAAVTPAGLDETVNLQLTAGNATRTLTSGELAIDTTTADSDHLHIGSSVPVRFAQTGSTTMRVGAIYKPNPLIGSFVTGAAYYTSHFTTPTPNAVLITTRPGASNFKHTLATALTAYPNLKHQSRATYEANEKNAIDTELALVYVLLALAILVALIGIVNTLMLSVFERTREIGLLRAVGMRRQQVQTMIRTESVIIAAFGAVIGIILGGVLGASLAGSLRNSGVTNVAIPAESLLGFLILSALLGLVAATWPARRAANLDVLAAIATE